MFCWGSTRHGELGLGGLEQDHILAPEKHSFPLATEVVQVSCGDTHTVMVIGNGELYSCGNNDFGQLGHTRTRTKPGKIDGLTAYRIMNVSCGGGHTLAFSDWGQLFAWGSNSYGQLGFGGESQRSPKIVKCLATKHVIQVSCGQAHSLALTNSGELYSWGINNCGQLGLGRKGGAEESPTLIRSLYGVPIAFIACGAHHSFAVSKSGAVFAWGANNYGQLGLNDLETRVYPTQVKTHRSFRIKYIACGEDFSVFLTADGGVFTCGAGMYGQLGHGSSSNEMMPRKVLELMGSTVTQIACGRKHTLALVPSRGRVYAFGLGGSGQLGTRTSTNANTPQVVLGPWLSPSGVPAMQRREHSGAADQGEPIVVTGIFSGGDQSFVTVAPYKKNFVPEDRRSYYAKSQIWTIRADKISTCRKVKKDAMVDQDLLSYLEVVFRSQACFNGSFLFNNEEHYPCSSKNHGIDIVKAQNIFADVARIENNTITDLLQVVNWLLDFFSSLEYAGIAFDRNYKKNSLAAELFFQKNDIHMIWESIVDNLLPSLSENPPDIETLRIYVTLPLYHHFEDSNNHAKLQGPFACRCNVLSVRAASILGNWWSSMPFQYVHRLVKIYKDVVLFHFRKVQRTSSSTVLIDKSMVDALNFLAILYTKTADLHDIPYDTFYLPELNEFVDVRVDYIQWLSDSGSNKKVFFCNYPFLFDAQAKTSLLQADQTFQMRSAMSQVITLAQFLAGAPSYLTEEYFLFLSVSRSKLVETTLSELESRPCKDLKKPLRVKFLGEEAEDGGGVRKEFFLLIMREVLDPKYGMFQYFEETRTIWFSELPFKDNAMYSLIGILCGLAIYNFTIIDLPFPLALYKKLLKKPVSYLDLKDLSPSIFRSLSNLLEYNDDDFEDVFSLNFEISRDILGEIVTVPLKPDGKNIPVTKDNRKEYVDLYADYMLNTCIEEGFRCFYRGFHSVCGGKILELFQAHELMTLVVGNENYDWNEFEANAQYKHGYSSTDKTIILFWEVFHELSQEEKRKFLLFLTGSDRIPIQGIKSVQITIQPTGDDKFLPVAHTCFNLLDLPRYKTKERLKYKLLQAIEHHEGFSLV